MRLMSTLGGGPSRGQESLVITAVPMVPTTFRRRPGDQQMKIDGFGGPRCRKVVELGGTDDPMSRLLELTGRELPNLRRDEVRDKVLGKVAKV